MVAAFGDVQLVVDHPDSSLFCVIEAKLIDASGVVDGALVLFVQEASSHQRAWSKTSSSMELLKSSWSKCERSGTRTLHIKVSI